MCLYHVCNLCTTPVVMVPSEAFYGSLTRVYDDLYYTIMLPVAGACCYCCWGSSLPRTVPWVDNDLTPYTPRESRNSYPYESQMLFLPTRVDHFDEVGRLTPSMHGNQNSHNTPT
jgi:hypothetical protein